jgi:hypothetical protein
MAFLLDLPEAPRRELAARWGVEETTAALYQVMTDPAALTARHDALGVLTSLARGPASFDDLLASTPASRERLSAELDRLGSLGLVLRLPERDVAPRPARMPFGPEQLYVPPDVARVLAGA